MRECVRACWRRSSGSPGAESEASGTPRPPEITTIDQYPLNVNNRDATKRVVDAFRGHFRCRARPRRAGPAPASEDFPDHSDPNGTFRRFFGSSAAPIRRLTRRRGGEPDQRTSGEPPSPKFAPVLRPTCYKLELNRWSSRPVLGCQPGFRINDAAKVVRLRPEGLSWRSFLVLDLTGTFVFRARVVGREGMVED